MREPEDTNADRRSVRGEYQQLDSEVEDKHVKHTQPHGGPELAKTIKKSDILFSRVKQPREAAVDSRIYGKISRQGLELMIAMEKNTSGCTPAKLVKRLQAQYASGWSSQASRPGDDAGIAWMSLGQRATRFFRTPPTFTCMLGPVSVQVKERKKKERRVKQADVHHALVQPEQILTKTDDKQQETDRNLQKMLSVLKQCKRAKVAQVINNPRSFGQTVENLFTLSFLVRNGRAMYEYGSDGSVDVVYTREPTQEDMRDGSAESGQFVFRLTMADWEEMQAYVGTPSFLMPHREYEPISATVDVEHVPSHGQENENGNSQVEEHNHAKSSSHKQHSMQHASQVQTQNHPHKRNRHH
mmetsp:Transcript_39899/g.76303  ORF Transcript_39899/g.76303 Transcript_39899/m.76303 type:complete len:356 (-) Transcript_39899:55-1122(-)